jgi:hypothetical protein
MSSLGIFIMIHVLIRGNPVGGLGCSAWVSHVETTPFLFHVFFPSPSHLFVGLAYQGKDIVLKFIIEYSSLRDFCFMGKIIGLFQVGLYVG